MISLLLATLSGAFGCEAVVDVRVHAPDGPHDGWDVVWEGEKIIQVGADLTLPPGCVVHTQKGGELTAGFVAPLNLLGLMEVELEPSTHDDAWDGDPVRAELRVSLAFNPRSVVIPVTRLGGITSAIITPTGGLVSGQAAWVTLDGGAQADSLVRPSVAMVADLRGLGNRAAALVRLHELIDDARYYASHGMAREHAGLDELSASRLDLEAMLPVARGEIPLIVRADRASDLEALIAWRADVGVKLVIAGAAEGWLVADALAAAHIPVVVDPLVYGPGGYDQVAGRAENAGLMAKAGVQVMLLQPEPQNQRALRFIAGNAVRGGLTHQAAIAALTSVPAGVFGVPDRGVIQVGAKADLDLWTGDPLDVTGRLAGLWIRGATVPLTSRQTALVDAWRALPRRLFPTTD